ncbi:hypothetical protein EGW08_020014 [Elysia chlorotica]|uniref:FZ domain-containing protein n=1 Tax=Elysia chlorotica TaxID=188477 RepID=A0A3S0Z955_ELYCH|nr:hypothetical protein EGW08_020014 [Elysia chlorotica]
MSGKALPVVVSKTSNSDIKKVERKEKKSKKAGLKKRKGYYSEKRWKKGRMLADQPNIYARPGQRRSGRVKGCLPFESDFCPNMPYNMGGFPSLLGHRNPDQANEGLSKLTPLMRTGCSARLHDFLCGVYFPQCIERKVFAPCRSLCEEVQADCLADLIKLGFAWPQRLRCHNFAEDSDCFGKGPEAIIKPPRGLVNKGKGSTSIDKKPSPPRKEKKKPSKPRDQSKTTDVSPAVVEMMNAKFMNPFMDWLFSSTKLNKDQARLAQEQAEVAKLTEQKLDLEISNLKNGKAH